VAPTEPTAPVASPEALAVAFGRLLRGAGVRVPVDTVLSFARALGELGVADRDAVYWAGRATLVRRPEDHDLYDRAFAVFWERRRAVIEPEGPARTITITLAADDGDESTDDGPDEAEPSDDPVLQLRFSASEVLRDKDFAACSDDELVEAQQLMTQLKLSGARRRSRRLVRSRRPSDHPDLRRTVQAALRAGGEPIRRKYLQPGERLRRLVLVLDVSGSMEPYARALVRFTHAAVVGRQRVEVFALGTRLTRITRELSSRDPDVALGRAARRVVDWSGGTRLGEGLRQFNDEWGVRGMARGAVVVILSDGWDRGSPELLAQQMARLHRVAFRVVWVNPLKVTPGYAPLARGMAAALPHVDEFVEGHSVAALEQLAAVIARP
jgi:uncharacterized protein with von Willebrand factor type A (vWA) domain